MLAVMDPYSVIHVSMFLKSLHGHQVSVKFWVIACFFVASMNVSTSTRKGGFHPIAPYIHGPCPSFKIATEKVKK